MNKIFRPSLLLLLMLIANTGFSFASIEAYTTTEFTPAKNQTFSIPVKLLKDARVTIKLYTSDSELVRTITGKDVLKAGIHQIAWDGKDSRGNIVPDEIYVPVLEAVTADGNATAYDPRTTSGGEVVNDLQVKITADGHISYVLPAPSRVLIRAGIKGGPMMRALANWEPRSAGSNLQHWDGMDASRVVDIRGEKRLAVLVSAFRLPAYSIITTGNNSISYADYRKGNKWPTPNTKPEDIVLTRGDVRIDRQYYISPAQARDPETRLTFFDGNSEIADELPVFKPGQTVRVKVDIPEADRWLIDKSLYEVAFFVDYEFISEEEQGYVPLNWRWKVDSLPLGQHVFTVNISGFDGKVGAATKRFIIKQ